MGVRSFLKGKVDKHGGVVGAAKAAIAKPVTMMSGGAGTRSAAPSAEADARALQKLYANLPKDADADGFRAVAPAGVVTVGKPGQFDVDGHTVAIFRNDDGLYAIDNACLHEDGPLGEGRQDGFIVTCAYHDWRYDVRTGACLTHKARKLATWEVREKNATIWVGPMRSRSSEDRGGEHDDGLKSV
jgi:nitrite reductase/ring-hydroxylating ferredoxin subunit